MQHVLFIQVGKAQKLWRGALILCWNCRFAFSRGDNKSGGWGDVLRVRSNTRSHEWSPRLYQWDQQGWCEFFLLPRKEGNQWQNHKCFVFMSRMGWGPFTDDVFCCSKNSSWTLAPSTLPPLLRYGEKQMWMFRRCSMESGRGSKQCFGWFCFLSRDIGVMVKLYPNMSPVLLHNSQLDHKRVRQVLTQ